MESLKNLNTAFKQVQTQAKMVVITGAIIAIAVCYFAFNYVQQTGDRMWVMFSNGAVAEVGATSMEANRLAEAHHHVEYYHFLMYNISPDPQSIEYNRRRMEYLGDESIKVPYEQKKEGGFYNQLISGNMRQTFYLDSMNLTQYPFVRIYGREVITRASSQLTKLLITSCVLETTNRSDNNANGLFMRRYKVEENKVLSEQNIY